MSENLSDIIREFFVDFLGSLIPGFLFLVVAIPLLVGWGFVVWKAILELTHSTAAAPSLLHFAEVFRFEILFLSLVLSYVMGFIFHRQDPKTPDQKSAAYVLKNSSVEDLRRSVIQPAHPLQRQLTDEEADELAKGQGGQFPYSHLQEYLSSRGLDHLAVIVPWKWADQSGRHSERKCSSIC